jgi:intracellular septation protein
VLAFRRFAQLRKVQWMTEPTAPAKPSSARPATGWVRLVSDLGPALVFFFTYQWTQRNGVPDWAQGLVGDEAILFATLIFLPAALAGFAFSWMKERQISPLGVFSVVMIVVFSGLAIWLKDDIFIKMRPTLIYALMGSILIVSVLVRRNVLKSLFGGALHMADEHWRTLGLRAGAMYLSLSALNELVWRTQPEPTWVLYNTWGDFTINLVFWAVNLFLLARHFTDAEGRPLTEASAKPQD